MKLLKLSDIPRCSGKWVTIDTETNGLLWPHNHIIGVAVYCPQENIHGYLPTLTEQERRDAYGVFQELAPDTNVIMHNAKFDLHFLNANPEKLAWNIYDTTDLIHLLDSRNKKALATAEAIFLGEDSKRDHILQAPVRTKIHNWPLEVVADYACNDVLITEQLFTELASRVKKWGLWNIFIKDMQYLKVLWKTERHGIEMDPEFLEKGIVLQDVTLLKLEERLYDSIGYTFNWRSHQQLSKAIYDDLGIEKPKNPFADSDGVDRSKFADAGLYKSTCTSMFLLTEKVHHPLGTLIGALRESHRMRATMKKYLELMDDNNRVHTNFNLTGTRTGRLSSSKPNMQNVPSDHRGRFTQSIFTGETKRTDEYNLRKAFIAPEGKIFLAVDYKQMEMRMFGILSEDPFMLDSLAAGKDIHADIAERVWGVRDKVHREWSKTISFGLIYGMTIGSLMFKLNMTAPEASNVCDNYWKAFPRIQPWLFERIDQCKEAGFLRYWSGRLWKEDNPKFMYKGANAQIQGGCAELLSIAGIRVNKWLNKYGNDCNIINFVHDEIITEIPENSTEECSKNISEIMQVEDIFSIPFVTDVKLGKTYGTLQKVSGKKEHYLE
ncbi:hypothetical protein LCGC14_0466340 [marine sediment metagenome]|uniref:DNA-directed DNA polymerase family A palm domain-containing protein n=1 Tax=marine sediment metagenome TaxID=412755 RepID=A0A0F9SIR7_9ZZZZ